MLLPPHSHMPLPEESRFRLEYASSASFNYFPHTFVPLPALMPGSTFLSMLSALAGHR